MFSFDGLGSLSDFLGAMASLAGLGISLYALKQSYDAEKASRENSEALRYQQEQQQKFEQERAHRREEHDRWMKENSRIQSEIELERHERERTNEARSMARSVISWWAKDNDDHWGLIVLNDGSSAGVVRDVEIKASTKNYEKDPLKIQFLPPGQFFVKSLGWGKPHISWDFPKAINSLEEYSPIVTSNDYCVHSIEFEDSVGERWRWTPESSLQKIQ